MALTTTDKQLPYLALQKEPALIMQELYIKYPDGGEFGWYAFVKEIGSFAYWDVESKSWKGDKALVFKEEAETAKDDAVIAKGQAQEAQTAAEGFAGDDFQPKWIHVSFKEKGNRKEILRVKKVNGKTVYERLK